MRWVSCRDFKGDARLQQRLHRARFLSLRPQQVGIDFAKRRRHERGMREDIHRHLPRERLQRRDVRLHVCPRGERRRQLRGEGAKKASVAEANGVQRTDPVREATHGGRRELAPQRVVPAELASAKHRIPVQVIEIPLHGIQRIHVGGGVARHVVRHARASAEAGCDGDDLGDRQCSIRMCGMRVAVRGPPRRHWIGGSVKGFSVSRGSPRVVSRWKVVRDVSRGVRPPLVALGIGVAPGMTTASDDGSGDRDTG